ncbi:MAG: ice-binding family protein [Vicinamibacterales bacterium]
MHVNTSHATTARRAALAGLFAVAWIGPAGAQPVPGFGGAESFAVLAKTSVTDSATSVIGGGVGVGPGGSITGIEATELAPGSSLHQGDAVAAQALQSAGAVYTDLAARTCLPANTDQPLGATLATGTHCFTTGLTIAAPLQLVGAGPWIVLVDGSLDVAPGVAVTAPFAAPDTCGGSKVYWQVDATAGPAVAVAAGAAMAGNVLTRGPITVGAGAVVDGRLFSLGTTTDPGSVSLAGATVQACSYGKALPTHTSFKVTGGGGINVPNDPAVTDPTATGTGFANYGFNGQPGTPATGTFNYVNHVVAPNLHINGPVTDVAVVALNDDGTPRTARLSGTCNGFLPTCTFSVLTEDNGEPPFNDRFGVTIVSAGAVVEARAPRQIRAGNIQFHSATLTTTTSAASLKAGQVLRLRARLRKDRSNMPADAYVVLQLPSGQLLSWTGGGLVPGLVPLARNFVPVDLDVEIAALPIPAGTPPGLYKWLSALTQAGTLNLLTGIAERSMTITP